LDSHNAKVIQTHLISTYTISNGNTPILQTKSATTLSLLILDAELPPTWIGQLEIRGIPLAALIAHELVAVEVRFPRHVAVLLVVIVFGVGSTRVVGVAELVVVASVDVCEVLVLLVLVLDKLLDVVVGHD
jgi:hypothetical protein